MKSKLIVKNFGPINNANLNLRNVNVLIGAQASGKSTLAKLYTICKSPVMYHELEAGKFTSTMYKTKQIENDFVSKNKTSFKQFKKSLENFSISDFLTTASEIQFDCPTHSVSIKNNRIEFEDKININKLLDFYHSKDIQNIKKEFDKIIKKSDRYYFNYKFNLFYNRIFINDMNSQTISSRYRLFENSFKNDIDINEVDNLIETTKIFKSEIFNNNALYIPAERTIINLIKQASFAFQKGKVPIPEHLLDYALIYQNATEKVKEFDLSFLKKDTVYKNVNGTDKIYFNKNKSIKLTESASGFQSVIPMLLPILNEKNNDFTKEHYSFVIEEPETNLFPKAQYELLKFLEKDRNDDFDKIDKGIIHTYTTHSPFILSSFNNMLYAYKKGNAVDELTRNNISKILEEENWINPEQFSAYQIINGKTKSIMDRTTGLIKENVIDYVSEDIVEDFRKIALATIE